MEPGTFEVVPVLRLQRRRLVGPAGEALPEPAVVKALELAAKGPVCVVDLDGLRRNKADLDTLRQMGAKGNLWADGGSRFATDAMDLLVAGAEAVTLRWTALAGEAELREAVEMSDALRLGLEFDALGAFRANPDLGDEGKALALARELSLAIVVLDHARSAPGSGLDSGLARRFEASGLDRWFAAGLRDRRDAEELKDLGYRGCLVPAETALEGFR